MIASKAPCRELRQCAKTTQRPLVVAVINNMPDASLRATERQICNLLGPAAADLIVDLKFYSLPGVARSPASCAHIAQHYEPIGYLEHERPDGLIVTGAEPKTARLADEPFWRPLTRIIDLADEGAIPAIWSCLAAHAFVLHVDGVEREPLAAKLSGVFDCTIDHRAHEILHRLPQSWSVPHSRRNGLRRKTLERQGYSVLSTSRAAGIDIFCRQSNTLQLFLQGHPEYDADTLLVEYRRDVIRTINRAVGKPPEPPANIGDKNLRAQLACLTQKMASTRSLDLLPAFDSLAGQLQPTNSWSSAGSRLVANWLAAIDHHRQRSEGINQAAPAHLPAMPDVITQDLAFGETRARHNAVPVQ